VFLRKIVVFWQMRATLSDATKTTGQQLKQETRVMHIKTLLAAFILTAAPGLAFAECSWGSSHQVTMSCADGTAWDSASQTCVATATS
jgi:hypothetical protein